MFADHAVTYCIAVKTVQYIIIYEMAARVDLNIIQLYY